MTITISANDSRSIKAIEIAAGASQWLKCHTRDGRKAYGIASQRDPLHVYLVTQTSCSCPDTQRHPGLACKHTLAVRLVCELAKAQHARPAPRRRGHLTLVQPVDNTAPTRREDDIFARFDGE